MVDVSAKAETVREAVARVTVAMKPATAGRRARRPARQGRRVGVARTAGIMAAKRTPELIPLCHPLRITGVDVSFTDDTRRSTITVEARVRTVDKTGVEMEALTAAAVAGLTIYEWSRRWTRAWCSRISASSRSRGASPGPGARAAGRAEEGREVKTALIHSDEWRRFDYGPEHPLRMERLGLTWRLMEAYGLTALPRAKVLTPEPGLARGIARFHTREYIEVLQSGQRGRLGAPCRALWPGTGRQPDLPRALGGGPARGRGLAPRGPGRRRRRGRPRLSLRGRPAPRDARPRVGLLLRQRRRARHHAAARARAGASPTWTSTPITATACSSPSTATRTSSPSPPTSAAIGSFPGPASSRRWGRATASASRSTCRSSRSPTTRCTQPAFEAVVPPILGAFKPDVLVLQLGIDSHRTDPLTHLALTVQGFTAVVKRLLRSPRAWWRWAAAATICRTWRARGRRPGRP